MADNFEPVGVRAVVEGADKYIADLGRMSAATTQFLINTRQIGTAFTAQSRGAAFASQATKQLETSVSTAAAATANLGGVVGQSSVSVRNLGSTMISTGSNVELLAQKLIFLAQKNIENASVTTRAIAASNYMSNSLVRLVQRKEELLQKLAKEQAAVRAIEARYKSNINTRKRYAGAIDKNVTQIGKLEDKLTSLTGSVNVSSEKVRAAQIALAELRESTDASASAVQRKRAALAAANKTYNDWILKQTRAEEALQRERIALSQNEEAMARARAEGRQWADDLGLAQNAAMETAQEIQQLDGAITRLGRLAVVLNTVKKAFQGAAAAAKLFGKALLLPHTLARGFGNFLNSFAGSVDKLSRDWFKMGNSIRFFGMSMTFLVSLPILGFLGALTKSAIEFETAFAGVIKTVDGLVVPNTLNELNESGLALQRNFRNLALEIPKSAAELAGLGQIAGQLGVRGVSNITSFVDTIARLGESTDISAEDAGTFLAQIVAIQGPMDDAALTLAGFTAAEIKNLTASEKFQAQIESIGSTLVGLGNKLPTTEESIARFAQRIAAAGALANVATADLFGIAAAFASVGIPAERGGTAVQKTFIEMIKAIQKGGVELDIFAKTAGLSVEEFAASFEEGSTSAGETFGRFVAGLGKNQDEAINILESLDLGNQRVINSLLSVANAEALTGQEGGRMAESLSIARTEFKKSGDELEDYNALQLESARRFATTEAQLTLLQNQFKDLGISIGNIVLPTIRKLVDIVRALVGQLEQLSRTEGGKRMIQIAIAASLIVAAIGPVIVAFGLLLSSVGFIGIAIAKVIATFGFLFSTLGLITIPVLAAAAAIFGLAVAFIASFKKINQITGQTAKGLIPRMWEFGKELILAFARGMAAALTAVVQVLIGIGRIIAEWLRPGSPPKIAPDLDKWGEEAMNTYMRAWLNADFDIFNKIADKIETFLRSMSRQFGEDLIPRIIGSRKAIAEAVDEIRRTGRVTEDMLKRIQKAMGTTSQSISNYITSLLEVAKASEQVKRAQAELEAIARSYEQALRPLNDRLKQISDRQREVADAQRITELEQILADPRASDLVRELASLEIEQIGLEQQVDLLEDSRDIEIERAEASLAAAEAQLEAAEKQLEVAEQMVDFQIKNNQLVEEYLQTLEQAKTAAKGIGELLSDITGLDLDEFDLDPGDLGLDEDFFSEIDDAINDSIQAISGEFEALVAELKVIFAPLTEAWGELGDVWAPIFIEIGKRISGPIGLVKGRFLDLQETVSGIADNIVSFFVGLGVVDVPLDMQEALDNADRARELAAGGGVGGFQLDPDTLLQTDKIIAKGDEIAGILENRWGQLGEKLRGPFEDIKGFIVSAFETISDVIDGLIIQLIDLGVIKPFGKYVEDWENIEDERARFQKGMELLSQFEAGDLPLDPDTVEILREMREEGPPVITVFEKIARWARNLWETFKDSEAGKVIIGIFKAIGAFWSSVGETLFETFANLKEPLGLLIDSIKLLYEEMKRSGALTVITAVLKGIGYALAFVFGWINAFILGALSGLLRGITALITGIVRVLARLYGVFGGVKQVLSAIWDFIKGIWAGITGDNDKARELFLQGWEKLKDGVLNIVGNLVLAVAEFFIGLGRTFWEVVSGYWEAFWGFWTRLYDRLVGESLIPDLVNDIISWFLNLFNGVIQWVTDLVTGVIEWFTNLYTDVVQWVTDLVNDVIQWFADLVTDVVEAVSGFVGDVVTFFEDIYNGIKEWLLALITEGPSDVWEFITGILDTVGGAVSDVVETAKEIGQGIIDGIKDAIVGGAGALLGAAQDAVGGLIQGAKDFLGIGSPSKEFINIGEEAIAGLVDGLRQARAALAKMVEATVDTFIEGFSGVFKAIDKIWKRGATDNINETKKWLTALIEMTTQWGQAMAIDGESSLFGSVFQFIMRDFLVPFIRDFIEVYTLFLDEVIDATVAWGQAMAIDGESSLFGSVFAMILELFEDMVKGFTVGLPIFFEMWTVVLENILQKFVDAGPAFYNAGASLIDSLAAGMLSRAQALYDTARRIANGVTDAVNNAYEQSSPSKVFIGVGKNIISGWQLGLEQNQGALLRTMDTIASRLLAAGASTHPAQRSALAAGSQTAVPLPAPVPSAQTITNAEVNLGGQVINTGIDVISLQILIEQALRNVL